MWSIVQKEYRQRARGMATLGLIMTYTIILGAVAYFVYLASYAALVSHARTSGAVGLAMSVAVFIAQMIMALMLALSLNASTIAAEKDQETFDLLNLTLFKSYEIVIGKFLSSTGFLFILVVTALPIYALAFTFGSLSLEAFWQLAAIVAGMTLFISSIGLLLSLISDDLRQALSRSFFVLIVLGIVTGFFGAALVGSFDQTPPNVFTYWMGTAALLLNPLWAAIDVFNPLSPNLHWQAPQPLLVPFLIKGNFLWAWSAGTQVAATAGILLITTLVYPRYRAGKKGGAA
ncbi:ABC transporter permease subunit [bacterium]|nr:ABC transporter permease subunit [bacterium]